ncbi:phthalate 3,4-dioxygenase ferredoxin reductase subunit [Nocardioides luteus]|uniref:Pyridine nucleotide-disulfide oxidoreductase n=1 Tax=Nocardioides luteus TaxID=1844 RepID=A0ABQ5SYB6_9ACTN|nr:FAD-dependent oxidoreductase [Nocardioides luteus]MDR7312593.1 phthalate 3,4-dioxygenase ferredoxin reductase subunit [Nocardioides luteus]GGR46136.1 pyridine nucleotide-disulfide oxidoreductase [Nocardioides luteus]GLJ68841.1 pyridine nucleotide-disulfide oxidoreductase [Nocardioides luteus]
MSVAKILIVGASVGGVRTAQALRADGFAGRIVLVDAECELPYDKPPLSKGLLLGMTDSEKIRLLTEETASELDLELRLGVEVVGLDAEAKQVTLAGGVAETYDGLVIATGVAASWGPWGGLQGQGVHVVRTLAGAAELRTELAAGGPVVVIGSGFIGAEVAASARALDLETHLIDLVSTPMSRSFDPEVGEFFARLHADRGVITHFGVGVDEVSGARGDLTLRLTDGSALKAAVVVVGIGARPATDWLDGSGLRLEDGVVCDEHLRAVGVDDVYAVGDVCRWTDAGTGELVRAEHWTNAVDQALCVARNIMRPEEPTSYRAVEYVWTDQYDWKIQIVGRHETAVVRQILGDPNSGRFVVLYGGEGGVLTGAAVANWPKALVTTRKAMAAGRLLAEVVDKLDGGAAPEAARVGVRA